MSGEGQDRAAATDPRIAETRERVLGAFFDLVLSVDYARIRVGDIIDAAGVGRSTFYEHYRNKDDVLRKSMGPLLGWLASAVSDDCDEAHLAATLEHFRENRRVARKMLEGESRDVVVFALADALEDRLPGREDPAMGRLLAVSIAEALVGMLRAWLSDEHRCDASSLAAAMARASSGAARGA